MVVLSLLCCARAFSSCGEQGLLFIVTYELLITVASLIAEHSLQAHGLQQFCCMGLDAQQHVGSSWTKDQTHVPCIDWWILIHSTTREIPDSPLLNCKSASSPILYRPSMLCFWPSSLLTLRQLQTCSYFVYYSSPSLECRLQEAGRSVCARVWLLHPWYLQWWQYQNMGVI